MSRGREATSLAPCPFCGSSSIGRCDTGVFWCYCEDCGAEAASGDTPAEGDEIWNRRAAPTPPAATQADMAAFGASEVACYLYPDDDKQRAAFIAGVVYDAEHRPPAAEAPGQEPVAVKPLEDWRDEITHPNNRLLFRAMMTKAGIVVGEDDIASGLQKVAQLTRSAPPTYADAEAKGFERGIEAAADAVKRAGERVGSLETPAMRGDNLAICLCTHFDDGGDNDGDTGWSTAATDGYDEVIKAIRDHYAAAIRSLASPAPKGET